MSKTTTDNIIAELNKKSTQDIINWIITNIDIQSILTCLKSISPEHHNTVMQMYSNRKNKGGMNISYPINFPITMNNDIDQKKLYVQHISEGTCIIPLAVFDKNFIYVEPLKCGNIMEHIEKLENKPNKSLEDFTHLLNKDSFTKLVPYVKKFKYISNAYSILYIKLEVRKYKSSGNKYAVIYDLYIDKMSDFVKECKKKENKIDPDIKFAASEYVTPNIMFYLVLIYFLYQFYYKDDILESRKTLKNTPSSKKTSRELDTIDNIKYFKIDFTNYGHLTTQLTIGGMDIEVDRYLVPTAKGNPYFKENNASSDKYRHIYSERYHTLMRNKLFSEKYDISKTNCVPLAFDDKKDLYLVKVFNEKGLPEYRWTNYTTLKRKCQTGKSNLVQKSTQSDVTTMLNSIEGAPPPYHTRFYGDLMPENFWEIPEGETPDLRMYGATGYDESLIPSKSSSFGRRNRFGKPAEDENEVFTNVHFNPFIERKSLRYHDVPQDLISSDLTPEAIQRIYDIYSDLNNCVREKLGFGSSKKVSLSKLRKLSAMGNVYLLGANFGKTEKFLTLQFQKGKWTKPTWTTGKGLVKVVKTNLKTKPTQKGKENFMKLRDFKIPKEHFNKMNYQFKPLKASKFGYIRKALEQINRENKGMQLYPLGKGAYLKGRHAGVSSTYSQRDSERLGLWKPRKLVPRQISTAQFQFGNTRPAGSCFGTSNDYGKIKNGYTGRYMQGIEKPRYGYKGTQGVYGGFTGVSGAKAPSSQGIRQGLIPLRYIPSK